MTQLSPTHSVDPEADQEPDQTKGNSHHSEGRDTPPNDASTSGTGAMPLASPDDYTQYLKSEPKLLDNTIGIWGFVKTGKTTFLTMLHKGVSQSKYGPLRLGNVDENTRTRLRKNVALLENKQLLPPTGTNDVIVYDLQIFYNNWWDRLRRRMGQSPLGREFRLNLLDVGGEVFQTVIGQNGKVISPDEQGYASLVTKVNSHLQNCKGLIMLFDCQHDGIHSVDMGEKVSSFTSVLDQIMNLHEGGYVKVPLAICVTKIDDPLHWDKRNNPELLAKHCIGASNVRQIEKACRTGAYKFFAISNIGIAPDDYQRPVSNMSGGTSNSLKKEPIPYGLEAPLEWIMKKMK